MNKQVKTIYSQPCRINKIKTNSKQICCFKLLGRKWMELMIPVYYCLRKNNNPVFYVKRGSSTLLTVPYATFIRPF
jgi:hypothetical protein